MFSTITQPFLLFFCCFFLIEQTNAQDSDLFGTWYLYQLEADIEGVVWDIEDIQPEYLPHLTINDDLTFEGIGACNEFNGDYSYDANQNAVSPNNFGQTLILCDNSEDVNFENLFFSQVAANTNHGITLNSNADYIELKLENFPGYIATYRNVSLSTLDHNLSELKIGPNPVSDKLYMSRHNTDILNVVIYDISGKRVLQRNSIDETVDVSMLIKGIYFIEVSSDKGKRTKKMIKI